MKGKSVISVFDSRFQDNDPNYVSFFIKEFFHHLQQDQRISSNNRFLSSKGKKWFAMEFLRFLSGSFEVINLPSKWSDRRANNKEKR